MAEHPTKEKLYNSINQDTVFTEDICKKIYGYSVTAPDYVQGVARKLLLLGRKDALEGYNEWLRQWKAEDDAMMKRVAEWYIKQDFCPINRKAVREPVAGNRNTKNQFAGFPEDW